MRQSGAWRPLALAVILSASIAAADAPFDPGSGRDASNDPLNPTLLPDFGAYSGELLSGDADWYGIDMASSSACLVVEAAGTIGHHLTLGERGSNPHSVKTPVPADLPTRLALAAPGVTRALVGLENTGTSTGTYNFTVKRLTFDTLTGVDGGTSSDAPSIPTTDFRVPSPCFKGGVGLKDTADFYAFDMAAGDQLVYSMAARGASSPTLKVLDAAGTVLGSVIGSGGIGAVSIPSSGTYYLAVSVPLDSSTSEYLVGIIGPDPPPGRPCRPHCMVS